MRPAMLRAASSSCLGAAQVLAAPAATMRDAGTSVALICLEAAVFLAALAPAMRPAMLRAATNSSLGAAQVLAPPAAPVSATVPRVA